MSYFTRLETGHTFSEGRSSTISVAETEALQKAEAELIVYFLILIKRTAFSLQS